MATKKQDRSVTWGAVETICVISFALLGLLGGLFYDKVNSKFDNVNSNLHSFQNSIGDLKAYTKTDIKDLKDETGKTIERLEERIVRLEYPSFKQKAASARLKPTFEEFKDYQKRAKRLGLANPVYIPIRLSWGFRIETEGLLSDGTTYNIKYRIRNVDQNAITFRFGGNVGTNRFKNIGYTLPLRENTLTSLTSVIEGRVGKDLPGIWIAVLRRPTKKTVILASGTKTATPSY